MSKEGGTFATAFRDVDGGADSERLAACLRFMEGLPPFAAYKAKSLEFMRTGPGGTAVDCGCGLGFDVRRLADRVSPGGRAIGIDGSERLLVRARQIFPSNDGVAFLRADLHRLPLAAASADAVRIDRTLQHVEDPAEVLAEMVRVLKPGGRIVCAEPDWSTFEVESDAPDVAMRVAERWRRGFRNPGIGDELATRLRAEGLSDVYVEAFALRVRGFDGADRVYDIRKTARILMDEDPASSPLYARWLADLEQSDGEERVSASVTLFLASATKPS